MQVSGKKHWVAPQEYLGEVPTTGKGVGVVVMDEGFDLRHPDLHGQVAAAITTGPQDVFDRDPVGHGTHILGILGGTGVSSEGRVHGVAPGARLIPVKLNLDQSQGWEKLSESFARGVNWAVQNKEKFNIRVINCSFVMPVVESLNPDGTVKEVVDPLREAIDSATRAGISIVAGVGNFTDQQPIATPAGNRQVIAVGALDTRDTPTDHSDDRVASFSSRGRSLTSGEAKPDLLAPGVHIMAPCAQSSYFDTHQAEMVDKARKALHGTSEELKAVSQELVHAGRLDSQALQLPEDKLRMTVVRGLDVRATEGKLNGHPVYIAEDGSSMAGPYVTGIIAHMVEANPALTPQEIKDILLSTAEPVVGAPAEAQGHGAVQGQKAIAEALRRAG